MYKLVATLFLVCSLAICPHDLFSKSFNAEFAQVFLYSEYNFQYKNERNPRLVIAVASHDPSSQQSLVERLQQELHVPIIDYAALRDELLHDNFPDEAVNSYILYVLQHIRNKTALIHNCTARELASLASRCKKDSFPFFSIAIDSRRQAKHAAKSLGLSSIDFLLHSQDIDDPETIKRILSALSKKQGKSCVFNRAVPGTTAYKQIRSSIKNSVREPFITPVFSKYNAILPGLYIGARSARQCPELMHAISHVLSVHTNFVKEKNKNITWKGLPIVDDENSSISDYFDETYDFIDSARTGILVHCVAGYSRSTTIVIAYLMRKFNVTYNEAYHYVRLHRSVTRPNPGFVAQLKQYERDLALARNGF